jgi:hypothetical protein
VAGSFAGVVIGGSALRDASAESIAGSKFGGGDESSSLSVCQFCSSLRIVMASLALWTLKDVVEDRILGMN